MGKAPQGIPVEGTSPTELPDNVRGKGLADPAPAADMPRLDLDAADVPEGDQQPIEQDAARLALEELGLDLDASAADVLAAVRKLKGTPPPAPAASPGEPVQLRVPDGTGQIGIGGVTYIPRGGVIVAAEEHVEALLSHGFTKVEE